MPPKRNTPKGGNPPAAKQQDNAAASSTGASSAAAVAAAFSEATSSTPIHLLLRGKNDIKIATISRSYLPGPTTTTSQPDGAVVESATLEHSYMTIADGGVTISDNLISGPDCSECEAIVCKTYPFAIVATAADVQVVPLAAHLSAGCNKSSSNVVIPEQKIVKMQVSPMERYLVLYRAQNPNDPTQAGGNMIVYRLNLDAPTPSVQLVMRCVQSAWPAFRFTQDETYAVRYVRGLLVLHDVTKDFAVCGDASQVEDADEGGAESDEDATATTKDTASKRALCNLNAGVAKGKELVMSLPTHGVKTDSSSGNTLAVFRPFTNNARKRGGAVGGGVNPGAASLVLYRLPQLQNPGLMAVPLHQAEDVALEWSPDGGNYLCVWIKLDSSAAGGGGGSDYYGKTYLYLIDVRLKKEMLIKFPSAGGAPSAIVSPGFSSLAGSQPVHDVKWCPSPSFYRDCATSANHPSKSSTQFFVAIHGEMPHSEATLFNERGQALYRFGRSACNVVHWSPNGAFAAFGGFGNLAGDVRICFNGEAVAQYYSSKDGNNNKKASSSNNNNGRKPAAASAIAAPPVSPQVGTLSDKTSEQSWSPDSRLYMTSTLFGKLRTSNKIALYKHNGEKLFEKRYTAPPIPNANPDLAPTIADDAKLFQATWLPVSYSAASGDEDGNEDVAFETLGRSPTSFPPPSPRMPASVYSKCSAVIEAAAKAASGAAGGAGAAAAAPPKVGLFKARGGGSATVAAAMSKGAVGGGTVKAAVPVGGNVVEKKKKRR